MRQREAAAQLGLGLEEHERQEGTQESHTGEREEHGVEFRVRFWLEELLGRMEHSPGCPAARSSGRRGDAQ